jgi:signal transduction histidine kinase
VLRYVIAVLLLSLGLAGECHAAEPWRIVIIRNWDWLHRVNVLRERELRAAVLEGAPRVVEIYPEQIDELRFNRDFDADLAELLKRKYRGVHVDAVIASGLEPLRFAARYRDEIWPGTPIVFNGVIDGWLQPSMRPPNTTGVTMTLDVAGTLSVARALVPSAKRVYLIAGTSEFDRNYLAQAKQTLARAQPNLEVRYIVGKTQEETVREASLAPPDSILLFLTVLRDAAGLFTGPFSGLMEEIARQSKAPLFSAVHTQWGRGPVGGSSARFDVHGRFAGELVRRVLAGESADSIPIRAAPAPSCELDWRALQRWSLTDADIPAECTVVNRPPAAWRTYLWPLLALVSVILLQAALIWGLVLQKRRRRVAEMKLRERSAELARVSRLAAVGELTASIAHEINQPMCSILANAQAARVMLERGTLDPTKLGDILRDIESEDLRAGHIIGGIRQLLARREDKHEALDVNAEIGAALEHVSHEIANHGVRVRTHLGAKSRVLGESVQLQQVLVNLILNAIDAMASESGATREITIATRDLRHGVEIAVSDTGSGVAAHDEPRLFTGMFTTKKHGMGFGLSIVRTSIEVHGGSIRYERNKPRGAVFRLWLPAPGHALPARADTSSPAAIAGIE